MLLRTLQDVNHCRLVINGSCSIVDDKADIQDDSKINLKELIVKASMSTQTLSALLKPLVIIEVKLQDCTITDNDKENNLLPKELQVICDCFFLCEKFPSFDQVKIKLKYNDFLFQISIFPQTYRMKCRPHNNYIYVTSSPPMDTFPKYDNVYSRIRVNPEMSLQVTPKRIIYICGDSSI